jgi:membrane-bound serine protease (ClpP class)
MHLPTHGLLGLGGVSGAALGAFVLLVPTPTSAPVVAALVANGWPLTIASSAFGVLGVTAAWVGYRTRRMPVVDPLAHLSGARGIAASAVAPVGTVMVHSQCWSAVTDGEPIELGEEVEIVAREGLRLRVRRTGPRRIGSLETLPSQGQVRPGVWVERTR